MSEWHKNQRMEDGGDEGEEENRTKHPLGKGPYIVNDLMILQT